MESRRERNEAVVRRYCDVWKRGDVAAIFASYHDELTLHWFGENPLAGTHAGKAAAIQALATFQQRTSRRLLEIRDVLASDEHVVLLTRERLERDGTALDANRVLVFRIRDDRLAECWVYDEDTRAIDALLR
jgi:ketosteroid isomerase-like protein